MITNLINVIASTVLLQKFGYHNLVQRYGLRDIVDKNTILKNVYFDVYEGLCDPEDRFQLHMASSKPRGDITYIIHDSEINDNVAVFSTTYQVPKSTLYSNWGVIVPWSDEVTIHDKNSKETYLVISESLGEDEHFQLMMERDVPEYEAVLKAIQYMKKVQPYLISYKRCSIIDYDHLDMDFEGFKLRDDFFTDIEIEFPGILKAFEEANKNGTRIDHPDLF